MPHQTPPSDEGLRARKKRATVSAIEMASLTLALEHGYDGFTVEQVCERADVSRRTFFNYFPTRDSPLLGHPILVEPSEDITALLDAHSDDLTRGTYMVFLHTLGDDSVDPEILRLRRRLQQEQPTVRKLEMAALMESGQSAMTVVESWLRTHPEHARLPGQPAREAQLTVNAVFIAVMALSEEWAYAPDEQTATAEAFERTIRDLRTVIDPA